MIEPTPTKRFILDPIRSCNILCKFCYYLQSHDKWKDYTWDLEKSLSVIDAGIARGNTYMDITGGEPTIYPHIEKVVDYALANKVRSCIITNGIVKESKIDSIVDAGLDDWLVSRHGLEDHHNFVTNKSDAYSRQIKFLERITQKHSMSLRFNCVISKFNQEDILEIAKEMAIWNPRIVNFINMNPHNQWVDDTLGTQDVIADLRIVEPLLNQAIAYLEERDIGVNVRYYPMCFVAEEYRRTVCNDLHVMMDPYEWDYSTMPKTLDRYKKWGVDTSNNVEEKEAPCNTCNIHHICGGANKHWHKASKEIHGEILKPQGSSGVETEYDYYRKHNDITLQPR